VLPEPSLFVTMWQGGQLVRMRLSEARKYAPAATLADGGNGLVKSRRNARDFEAQSGSRCRYCGASFAAPRGTPSCPRCAQIRERHEAAAGEWIGDDKLYLRVQRTLANRERTAGAERVAKHGPGRFERDGPAVKVSDAVAKAKRVARANFRQRSAASVAEFAEAAV
jgi:hypothetical protein